MGLLRRKYKISQRKLPNAFLVTVDEMNFSSVDRIVTVCSCLLNLCNSIVAFD